MGVLTKRLIATTVVVIFFRSSKVLASNQNFRQNKKSIFLEKKITLHFEDFQSYKGFGIFDPSLITQKKSNLIKSIFVKINIDKMKNNILKENIIYDNSVNNHLIEKESINNVKKMLKIGLSKSIIQYSYIGFAWLSINQFYKFLSSYKPHPANVARFNKFFYRNLRGGYDDSDSSFKNLLEN